MPFSFLSIPPGRRSLVLGSLLGLLSPDLRAAEPFVVPAAEQALSESEEEPSEAEEEVLVSGQRPPPTRGTDPSVAHFTIRRASLETPGLPIGDALRDAPGIQVSQLGGLGSPTTARLRGATAAQTPVYFGRVKLNDEVGGVADLGLVPTHFVESIQIYRSSAPRTAAEFGIGGAIFLVPRKAPETGRLLRMDLGSFGTRGLSLSRGYSSEERTTQVFVSLDGAKNDYSFKDTRGTLFTPDDDQTTTLKNADSRGLGTWIHHRERFGKVETEFFFGHASREQGAVKLALVPTREARVAYDRTMAQITSTIRGDRSRFELLSAAIVSETAVSDPLRELSPFSERLTTPGERFEQAILAEQDLSEDITLFERLSASIERFRRFEQRDGAPTEVLSAERLSTRLAAGLHYRPTSLLTFSVLGELRCVSTTPLSACAEPVPGGRASATFSRGSFDAFASLARAVRVPTLSELYGFSPIMRGNPRLEPEEATTGEIGMRYAGPVRGGLPLFWMDASAFIRSSENLVLFLRSTQGYLTPQNRASSRTIGAELALGLNPGPFAFTAQASWLDPRDTSPNRTTKNDFLPFLSAVTASATAHVRVLHVPESQARIGARAFVQSSRFSDPAGLGVIPEQGNVDLEAEAGFAHGELTLRASLRNLFDSARFDVVGYPLPGRSLFFSLETRFK
jgi:vitamin B12 transporter